MESSRPVAEVKPQIRSSALKQNYNCKNIVDESNLTSVDEKQCDLTISPFPQKLSMSDENQISGISQLATHLKARLNLKSGSGVNGILNGLGAVDFSRSSDSALTALLNGKSNNTTSHCAKCEIVCNNTVSDCDLVSKSVLSHSDVLGRDSEMLNGTVEANGEGEGNVQDKPPEAEDGVKYVSYKSELQMPDIMRLIQKDLSEPYSIYTYRYFIHNWPKLCFLAMDGSKCVGAIVCKLDVHRKVVKRGYIAMLAVDENYRKRKIGSNLVLKAIRAMVADDADEVVLETEITNRPALRLYENLGFVRDKRLFRYYLNGVDALRLKLWLR